MRRNLTITALLVLVAVLAGFVWARSFVRSPRYSLARLAMAANEGNWAAVQLYMDVSGISEDAATQIVERQVGAWPFELGDLDDQLAEAAIPLVADRVEDVIRLQVLAQGSANSGIKEQVGSVIWAMNTRQAEVRGDNASLTADVPFRGRTYRLHLSMRRADGRWRVMEIDNLDDLLGSELVPGRLTAQITRKAPSYREPSCLLQVLLVGNLGNSMRRATVHSPRQFCGECRSDSDVADQNLGGNRVIGPQSSRQLLRTELLYEPTATRVDCHSQSSPIPRHLEPNGKEKSRGCCAAHGRWWQSEQIGSVRLVRS